MKWYLWSMFFVFNGFASDKDTLDYADKSILKTLRKVMKTDRVRMEALGFFLTPAEKTEKYPGKYFQVKVPSHDNVQLYLYVGRVNSCRAGGCSSASGQTVQNIEYEYFDYFIVFRNDATVLLVKVFNYEATHGQEITSKGWLKQFSGFSPGKQLKIGKNIDAISGATVSVFAITLDIQDKTLKLKSILDAQEKLGKE